ncbi:hypothetical protein HYFRA_00003650 [Hymenoscyphus fraxineus]|uniref:Uncharacterized protein n=1 Tax=Hymenoscyphus fraxineus TaxID=746836 RepID=A0A9N9PUJ7_9HELO|nr:hypothetical protein HYFRA_00003650 [Hymenoscyphus fraxineus]
MSPPSNQPKPHLLAWNPSPYTAIPNPQSDISLPESSHSQTPPHKLRTTLPFLLHLLFFTTYSTLFFTSQRQTNNLNPLGIPYTQKIFEVNTSLKHSSANLYAGDPSEELEAAWQKLLKNSNIRIPESEIKKLGRLDQSVRFTDGSGYFAQMSVYHHLHCIVLLPLLLPLL